MFKSNILIVGPHRSGTTSLMKGLGEILELKTIEEPWNYYLHNTGEYEYPYFFKEYRLVKSLIEQKAIEWKKLSTIKFYLHCFELFDHIIILSRRDRTALAESYAHQMQFGNFESWHTNYTIKDTGVLNLETSKVNNWCDNIVELSNKSNIPITWHEDLYSGNTEILEEIVRKWGFSIDIQRLQKYINPKNKYRI